jgi:hypothetical protein
MHTVISLEKKRLKRMDEPRRQSPVEAAIGIKMDLAKFQQTSSPEALRASMHEALHVVLPASWHRDMGNGSGEAGGPRPSISPIVEYLEQRGLVYTGSNPSKAMRARMRARRRRMQQQAAAHASAPTTSVPVAADATPDPNPDGNSNGIQPAAEPNGSSANGGSNS